MKKSKWIYLFLALLFPILLSLFLKYFGKSEFSIPVYYEHQADSLSRICGYQYNTPYTLPDSVARAGVSIITIDSAIETKKNFERVSEEVMNDGYNLIVLKKESSDKLLSCVLFLNKPWTTVLVDEQKRIRGYYAPHTREETDRLIVELKILLKQY